MEESCGAKKSCVLEALRACRGRKNGSLEMDCGDGGDLDSGRHLDSPAVFAGGGNVHWN